MGDAPAPRVAVVGAVGGAGASAVACGLALAWAVARGAAPWLVELDGVRSDLAARWDLPDERTVADLDAVAGELDADHLARAAVTHRSGAVALLGPRSPADPIDGELARAVVGAIDPGDPVVLDLGAGDGAAARRAGGSVLLIVTPACARGARVSRRLLSAPLGTRGARPRLVVVHSGDDDLSVRGLERAAGGEAAAVLPRATRDARALLAGRWPRLRRRGLVRPLLALAEDLW